MSLQPLIDAGLSGDVRGLAARAAAALALACVSEWALYIKNVLRKKAVTAFVKNLRLHYFESFFRQDAALFLEKDGADCLSKLTVDADVIGQKYCESLLNLYHSLWSLTVSVVCIACARWELAVYAVLISLVSVNLPKLFQKGVSASEQAYLDSGSAHIRLAQESIRNYLVIRLFALIPAQLGRYRTAVSDVEERDNARQRRASAVDAAAGAVSSVSFILIIALCMLFVLRGRLSVGYTMSVSQLLGGVMYPFETLPGCLAACRAGKAIYRSNEEALGRAAGEEGGQPLQLTYADDRVEIDRVSFAYGADRAPVLRDICLSLDLKKKYAVVGESGSGKSTLAKIIMGLLEPAGGRVLYNGVPLDRIDKRSLYRAVAYQSQTASFFDGSIRDNILLGRDLPAGAWRQLTADSRLEDMLDRLPDGELTEIEENGKNISGGEARRICLARCLAGQPAFIIFDEIAASLDEQNASAIEKSLLSLESTGILQITHRIDEESMGRYDSIFVLKDGRISEQGTWKELVEKRGDFYKMLRRGAHSERKEGGTVHERAKG